MSHRHVIHAQCVNWEVQVKGEARASLAATLIEDVGRNNLTESENAWTAGTM